MTKQTLSKEKFERLQTCSTPGGIIAAAALDQRGSLKRALAKVGLDASDAQLREFKTAVATALSPHASALLLEPRYGLDAAEQLAENTGLLLAYEESGYDNERPGRFPDLQEGWSVKRLAEAGATAVKLLVYYNPAERDELKEVKHAFVERVGAECEAEGLPFFLEPMTYDDSEDDEFAVAKGKPERVTETVREFSKDRYRVDVLKVEFPTEAAYTRGLTDGEQTAYDMEEVKDYLVQAAEAAEKPFIYLSAGVDMAIYAELLEVAGEVGTGYSGVLCGRATWKGGIAVYASQGLSALEKWLEDEGVPNIQTLNAVLEQHATPWGEVYRKVESDEQGLREKD